MQGLAFDSPLSGSSIPLFSRTEKTKSHPILAVQQVPIPCSLFPALYSMKKAPNLRPQTPRSPAIRDDFNFVDDVLAAILIKSGQLQVSSAGKTGQLQSTTFSETGNL
jgi:hypothetical protein